jgi:DNA-binding transcriptional ArsR family regulator
MSHGGGEELEFLTTDTARAVAETMAALATPSRVRILSRLAAGACSVGQLSEDLEVAQPAISQQLRVLRHLGLVVGARDGRRTIYALHDAHVQSLLSEAVSHTEHLRLGLSAHPLQDTVSA